MYKGNVLVALHFIYILGPAKHSLVCVEDCVFYNGDVFSI